jgi:hypothetical protein
MTMNSMLVPGAWCPVSRHTIARSPILPGSHIVLARVVRAVGEPDLEVAGPGLVHDVDAIEVVIDRLLADARIRVRDAAEDVVVVLEGV